MTRRRTIVALAAGGAVALLVFAAAALANSGRFTDVTDAHPVEAIEWAAEVGITAGYGDGTFRPDEPLSRSHALIFMERFYDQVLGAGGDDQHTNPDFTRADMMALLHTMATGESATSTATPAGTTTAPTTTAARSVTMGSLGVRVAPEDCAGYSRSFYEAHGTSWRALGGVGYLTGRQLTSGDVDHVVSLEEAWCSGIRTASFGSAPGNHRASVSSVNRGKGGRDPLEWWNTSGSTSPRRVSYPGWCDYLELHVQVKQAWDGTMDQAEHDFVAAQLGGCASQPPATTPTTQPPTTTTPTTTSTTAPPRSGCTHWHAGHPKHTHPGTNHDGTHRSGKCAGY